MNASEPHVRRRGYFLSESTDSGEPETGELDSPEGFTFRVRIVRPLRQRAAVARRAAAHRTVARAMSTAATRQAVAGSPVRSTTATGTHRR